MGFCMRRSDGWVGYYGRLPGWWMPATGQIPLAALRAARNASNCGRL